MGLTLRGRRIRDTLYEAENGEYRENRSPYNKTGNTTRWPGGACALGQAKVSMTIACSACSTSEASVGYLIVRFTRQTQSWLNSKCHNRSRLDREISWSGWDTDGDFHVHALWSESRSLSCQAKKNHSVTTLLVSEWMTFRRANLIV